MGMRALAFASLWLARTACWPSIDFYVYREDGSSEALALPTAPLLADLSHADAHIVAFLRRFEEADWWSLGSADVVQARAGLNGTQAQIRAHARGLAMHAARAAAPFPPSLLTPHLTPSLPFSFLEPLDEAQRIVEHVRRAIANAREGLSKLASPPHAAVLELEGMSNAHNRHLLNNLCAAVGARYLEVGTWKGSTLVSAVAGNERTLERMHRSPRLAVAKHSVAHRHPSCRAAPIPRCPSACGT